MTSPFNNRRAVMMSAVTMFAAAASFDAAADHSQDHAAMPAMAGETAMPAGDAAPMDAHGAMDMPAMDMPAMGRPMDHDRAAGHGPVVKEGHAMTGAAGHAMPDMHTMGALASNVHEVHLAVTQRVLAHKTTIYALLVALGIEREQNEALLRQAQRQFEQVQTGLRHGDEAQGLEGAANPAVHVALQGVDSYWANHDAVIQRILAQPTPAAEHITMLTVTDANLHRSLNTMVEAVERYSYEGRGYSILLPTVRHAQHLSAVVQELATEFLLVAYGHERVASERALAETAAEFEQVLEALTNGDHELHVLGAPTPEIMTQYLRVRDQWQQCWAAIEAMSADGRFDPSVIGRVLAQVDRVAVEVEVAVGLYHLL